MSNTSIPSFRDRIYTAGSLADLDFIKAEMNKPDVKMRARTYRRNQAALYTRKLELQQKSR